MKILFVSNLYPPYFIGGYEIGCRDIAEALKSRGHSVRVLTSTYQHADSTGTDGIFRELRQGFSGEGMKDKLLAPLRERANRRIWRRHLRDFQPDVVYFWNMAQISLWPLADAADLSIPAACYVSDQWLESPHTSDFWAKRFASTVGIKNLIHQKVAALWGKLLGLTPSWPPASLPQLHFTSGFIRRGVEKSLIPPAGSEVIHWGVHPSFTSGDPIAKEDDGVFSIAYSGQIVELKGVRTAILGVAELVRRHPDRPVRFLLAGGGPPDFRDSMLILIGSLGLEQTIKLVGRYDRPALMTLLAESQVFILASEWEEPFAIAPLEAMAMGCAVVGTTTGGSGELFRPRENALVFKAGDPGDLADKLESLLLDPELQRKLSVQGSADIRERHRLSQMVDRIEAKLLDLATAGKSAGGTDDCRKAELGPLPRGMNT